MKKPNDTLETQNEFILPALVQAVINTQVEVHLLFDQITATLIEMSDHIAQHLTLRNDFNRRSSGDFPDAPMQESMPKREHRLLRGPSHRATDPSPVQPRIARGGGKKRKRKGAFKGVVRKAPKSPTDLSMIDYAVAAFEGKRKPMNLTDLHYEMVRRGYSSESDAPLAVIGVGLRHHIKQAGKNSRIAKAAKRGTYRLRKV